MDWTLSKFDAFAYLDSEQLVPQWVDDNEDVTKLGWQDASAIVTSVFRPNHVDLIVTNVSERKPLFNAIITKGNYGTVPGLAQHGLLIVRGHPSGHVKHDLDKRRCKIWRRFSSQLVLLQSTHKASVCLQLNL